MSLTHCATSLDVLNSNVKFECIVVATVHMTEEIDEAEVILL